MPNLAPEGDFYEALLQECKGANAELIVVSKTQPEKAILELFKKGQRKFGENRAHELIIKASLLPSEIEWHLIGHLQTNKVQSTLPYLSCIQSLDSRKLWIKIHEVAKQENLTMNCLLQIKIAAEESKYGWQMEELVKELETGIQNNLDHVNITGVMGMGTLTNDQVQVRKEFRQLKEHFQTLKEKFFNQHPDFKTISMGMSGDYKIALEEGSNMVRIGSLLFPPKEK